MDSGCSKHMTGHKGFLRDFKLTTPGQYVTFGNNMKGEVMGHGDITNGNFTVKKVAYVNGLKHNLISVAQLCDRNHEVLFTKTRSLIMDTNKNILVDSQRKGNMYPLDIELIEGVPDICLLSKAASDISWLWHRRLSHLNFGYINKLIGKDLVRGLPLLKLDNDILCAACEQGKLSKSTYKSIKEHSVSEPLQLLHTDLCGPSSVPSLSGKKYILVLVDDYTKFTWVFFLRAKSETTAELINFIKYIEVRVGKPVRRIRSDNGGEFKNNILEDFLVS
ncbi:DDE-type integrase/transposase/recombinase, partial [Labilibacter sediminis]